MATAWSASPPSAPASSAAVADTLLIAGMGYTGRACAIAARDAGMKVIATARDPHGKTPPAEITLIGFDQAGAALADATHLLITAAPTPEGDPLLIRFADVLETAPHLRWVGYCSTTGVYGNHDGGAVDETTPPTPTSPRTERRVAAEARWSAFAGRCTVDILRLAGIYGPGRSALDDLRDGTARRIDRPDHRFSRIHVDDIAHAMLAAIGTARSGIRILNIADDEPTPSADVIAYAATLLGLEPPPLIPFAEAEATMSAMARSFWADNRTVRSAGTRTALNRAWRYPSYREGLRAILESEAGNAPP